MPRVMSARSKRLLKKKSQLLRQLKDLGREIRVLERSTGKKARGPGGRATAGIVRRPNARRLNDVTVSQAIVQLLREVKRPMNYREIADRLVSEGRYRTRSRNFLSTVAITILRERRIRRVKPGVYTLRR